MDGQTSEDVREHLSNVFGNDLLFADGFDAAIIGVCGGHDSGRVAYSVQEMIKICEEQWDMPYDEAVEYLEFNTLGAYVGEKTPLYIESWFDD